jgi:RNA polymerase sigma factor (sigma-70 family)
MSSQPPSPSPEAVSPTDRPPDEFQQLLLRAANGDEDAALQLYNRYQKDALRVVRSFLRYPQRKTNDSTDFTQEAWLSVLQDVREGKQFACAAQFVKFLMEVARRKVLKGHRDQVQTQKRSLAREEPLGEHVDPAEGPAEQAADEDIWRYLLTRLSNRDQSLFEGLHAGEGLEALARQMDVSVKGLLVIGRRAVRVARAASAAGAMIP